MSSIQQLLLGTGSAVTPKTYIDDLFSTFLYKGTSGSNTVNTGLDISGEGGLVWVKNRTNARNSMLFDTVRGVNQEIATQSTSAENDNTSLNQTFTSTGFTFNTSNLDVNSSSHDYASWSFRKAPGFFDIVTYTGTGSTRTVAHNLGCIPGCIMIKCRSHNESWSVYHRSVSNSPAEKSLYLNSTDAASTSSSAWNNTQPTSTEFTVSTAGQSNDNGKTYVAYVFAGGESTASDARCVGFNGSSEYLSIPDHTDLNFGSGDVTIECWFNAAAFSNYGSIFGKFGGSGNVGYWLHTGANGTLLGGYQGADNISTAQGALEKDQWYHVALVRHGTKVSIYLNGTSIGTPLTTSASNDNSSELRIGSLNSSNDRYFNGEISNFRIVKGTALYTSSFRPPTRTLTNISGTVLLCCNNSSVTGSTVTPATISKAGNPNPGSASPFDDPAGLVFGENGDQGLIKFGSYKGNGDNGGPNIYIGWEPQWVMWKNSGSGRWFMTDSMRGLRSGYYDNTVKADGSDTEYEQSDGTYIDVTSTGFKIAGTTHANTNTNGDHYVYMAIRRPDGYVQKPATAATSVFATAKGTSDTSVPTFPSGFVSDFAIRRAWDSTSNWLAASRLTANSYVFTNGNDAETGNDTTASFDYNTGFGDWTSDLQSWQAWQWKRHNAFDVVTYTGNGVTDHAVPHQMNSAPEMMWIKNRTDATNWRVFHIGHGGGTNPDNYGGELNGNVAPHSNDIWFEGNPTSTHMTFKTSSLVNAAGKNYLAMLFSSSPNISKVGSYSGSGSAGNAQAIGFQPRLLITKRIDSTGDWNLFDTVGGISNSGADGYLQMNTNQQRYNQDYISISSTGFSFSDGSNDTNGSGASYIYYAHA